MSSRTRFLWSVVALTLPLSVTACDDDTATGNGNGALTADVVESFLNQNISKADAWFDGLSRLLLAVGGGPADGVTVSLDGTVATATVDIDLDGDGTRESSVGGTLTFNTADLDLANGATLSITDIDSPGFSGSMTANVMDLGSGSIEAIGNANFPLTGGPTVDVPEFGLSVTPVVGFVFGFADVEVGGLSMEILFEDDGLGGWQMRVIGSDFEFVV